PRRLGAARRDRHRERGEREQASAPTTRPRPHLVPLRSYFGRRRRPSEQPARQTDRLGGRGLQPHLRWEWPREGAHGGNRPFPPWSEPSGRKPRAKRWAIVDSNHGPPPYQSGALTD